MTRRLLVKLFEHNHWGNLRLIEACSALSGEALLAFAREPGTLPTTRLRTTDGYDTEPWVVMVQVINHGMEHRRQLSGLLMAQGLDHPELDGWSFGEAQDALVPVSS